MVEENEGRTQYVIRRLSEAETPDDVERIEQELVAEEIPKGTVSGIKSEMNKKGLLPKKEAGLVQLKHQFPQRLGRYDVITPEAVLEELRLQDGDYKVGFHDGIMMLLLAARLNQQLATAQSQMMDPMIRLTAAMRQEELEAARKARGEGEEIAKQAAQETARQLGGYFDERLSRLEEKKPDIASTPNPMQGLLARMLETTLGAFTGRMLGGGQQPGQATPLQGWTEKEITE